MGMAAVDREPEPEEPGEQPELSQGLRERKKRLTRQRISDVATAMFTNRGFDNVTVAEIAEEVGVSEKTIYNYFPTKESLVYDQAEEQLMELAAAVRDRPPGSSPTAAFVATLKADLARFGNTLGDTDVSFLQAFGDMIRETPALRAAWGEHRHRMVETLTAILADEAGIDPRDPEPVSAARTLVSLLELSYDSQMRHAADCESGAELLAMVESDLDRGARLVDTGLWSFNVIASGQRSREQVKAAATAAEQARKQVMITLREARKAWSAIRDAHRELERQHHEEARQQREQQRAAQRAQMQEAREAQRAHLEQARAAGRMRGRGRS